MKLVSCRIANYRSIRDTGDFNLSPDNITCIIGQNESGKTSLLDALFSFGTGEIDPFNLRTDGSLPSVTCKFKADEEYFRGKFSEYSNLNALIGALSEEDFCLTLTRKWQEDLKSKVYLQQSLVDFLQREADAKKASEAQTPSEPAASPSPAPDDEEAEETVEEAAAPEPLILDSLSEFYKAVSPDVPKFEFFDHKRGLLPNTIDVEELKNGKGGGYKGADNFLKVAGFDVDFYLESLRSNRLRAKNKVETLSAELTKDLQSFWAQHIGGDSKITIEFDVEKYDVEQDAEKAGKPFVIFWVKDKCGRLHPTQRSEGVRWFLSFYFQLKASSMSDQDTIFLIDEPGRSLHEIAQANVLKLFETLKENVQMIYTTHSPHLIDDEHPYRIIATQRSMTEEMSDTDVIPAHELGAATADTLSPLYVLSGIDITRQTIIGKTNNIVLEEISAYYYFKAFQKLTGTEFVVHYLPATGVSQVLKLVYLLLGWDIKFSIVVDGDAEGDGIHEHLKENLFQNDREETNKHVYRLRGFKGIEDIFTKTDFTTHILEASPTAFKDNEINSAYLKRNKLSKGYLAGRFFRAVNDGEITLETLNKGSSDEIKKVIENIQLLLTNQTGTQPAAVQVPVPVATTPVSSTTP